jgi:hypothetical protein
MCEFSKYHGTFHFFLAPIRAFIIGMCFIIAECGGVDPHKQLRSPEIQLRSMWETVWNSIPTSSSQAAFHWSLFSLVQGLQWGF